MKVNPPARLRATGLCVALLTGAAQVQAQTTPHCPTLPASSGLQWQEIRNPDLLFCKAMDANGKLVFSVMVSGETPFVPVRSQRAEAASIDGRSTWWYRTQIASRPELLAREAAIELPDGQVAYINIQAGDDQALQVAYSNVAALQF